MTAEQELRTTADFWRWARENRQHHWNTRCVGYSNDACICALRDHARTFIAGQAQAEAQLTQTQAALRERSKALHDATHMLNGYRYEHGKEVRVQEIGPWQDCEREPCISDRAMTGGAE